MNEMILDPRSAALAALTAVTHCDAIGYAEALIGLPPIEGPSCGGNDEDADKAMFSGSGVAN